MALIIKLVLFSFVTIWSILFFEYEHGGYNIKKPHRCAVFFIAVIAQYNFNSLVLKTCSCTALNNRLHLSASWH